MTSEGGETFSQSASPVELSTSSALVEWRGWAVAQTVANKAFKHLPLCSVAFGKTETRGGLADETSKYQISRHLAFFISLF